MEFQNLGIWATFLYACVFVLIHDWFESFSLKYLVFFFLKKLKNHFMICRHHWAESTQILYNFLSQWEWWSDELWNHHKTRWRILSVSSLIVKYYIFLHLGRYGYLHSILLLGYMRLIIFWNFFWQPKFLCFSLLHRKLSWTTLI